VRLEYLRRVTYRPGPRELRASDADRDRVIALLAEAAADGRLTPDEHAERVGLAYQARTLGELAPLTTDLVTATAQPIRLDGRRPVTGILGRDSREGRWVVPASLPVVAVFGEVELDLRDAIFASGRTIIFATVVGATLHLIVPEGVVVETSGHTMLTRRISKTYRDNAPRPVAAAGYQPGPGRPVIEIRTVAFGGTIRVTSPKRPRRMGGLRRG
jgi:hypothetical protein